MLVSDAFSTELGQNLKFTYENANAFCFYSTAKGKAVNMELFLFLLYWISVGATVLVKSFLAL